MPLIVQSTRVSTPSNVLKLISSSPVMADYRSTDGQMERERESKKINSHLVLLICYITYMLFITY